jgi:putative acetyltransferase
LAGSPLSLRPEAPGDHVAIRRVHESAFPTAAEADLVDLCRSRRRIFLSLVALQGDRLLAHVLFTPVTLHPPHPGLLGVGLGPIAVLPDCQRTGIGSRLMTDGLALCQSSGVDFVVLLGDPGYYTRFGFIPGREFGLSSDYGQGVEFQARELRPGALRGVRALVRYVPEFSETVG